MLSIIFWLSAAVRVGASVWALAAWYRLRDWRVGVFAGMAVLDLALQFRPGRAAWDPTPSRAVVLVIVTATLILAIQVVIKLIVLERASAELAQRRGEDFQLLYDNASDGIFVAAPDRRYLHANVRALELLGYTLSELQALRIDDVVEASEAPGYRDQLVQLGSGERLEATRRLRRKDGSLVPVEIGGRRLADGRLLAVVRDISRRTRAEEALAAQERVLAGLVSAYPGLIYHGRLNGAWEMDYVNDGCVALTGYTADELQFNGVPALVGIVHPDDRDWLAERCAGAIAQRLPCRNEYRIVTRQGEVRWVFEQAEGSFDAAGRLVSVSGYVSDITARKESEGAVRRSERAMALAQSVAELGSWRWSAASNRLDGSEELFRIHGLPPEGALPAPADYLALVHPEDRAIVAESFAAVGNGIQGSDLHFRIRTADGVERHLHSSYVIERDDVKALMGAHGVVQDVTEHWRALDALKASEANYRLLFEHSGESVTVVDRERRIHAVNARMVQWMGRPLEELVGRHLSENLAPSDTATALAQLDHVFTTREPLEVEATLDLPVGTRVLRRTIRPVVVDDGVAFAIVFENDITDHRELQSELRASAKRAQQLIETSQDGVMLTDAGGTIIEANAAYARMIGYTEAELRGRKIHTIDAETDASVVDARLAATLRDGGIRFTTQHRHKDGALITLEISATVLHQQGGPVFAAFLRDVTEERERQALLTSSRAQLRALAARLEVVREEERTSLAREIHDELGQGLTSLKLDLAWLRDQLPAKAREARDRGTATLGEIDHLIDAARALAARLRPAILDDLGLVPAVEWQAAKLFERAEIPWRGRLELTGRVSPESATTIFRIFQEAATNVVRHANATQVEVTLQEVGSEIELRVADDGSGYGGAAAERQGHLGLVGMRERASSAGGTFEIRARPTGGTEVVARIPRDPVGGTA